MISLIATWRSKVIALIATDRYRRIWTLAGPGHIGAANRQRGPAAKARGGGWAGQATGWAWAPEGLGEGVGPGCGSPAWSRIGEFSAYSRATRII